MPANYIYTVYKTTNLVNGKIYIGKHTTLNPHDDYLGSGIHLKRAIKKYGKSQFTKEVLYEYDNLAECYEKERELVSRDFIKRDDNYNLNIGGCGNIKGRACEDVIKKKISNSSKGRIFSESHRRKKSLAQMGKKNHRYGIPKTEDEKNENSKRGKRHNTQNKKY